MRTATIYNFLLEANLMACIAILLMLPIRRFLRPQLSSRVICLLWLMVAVRLLCPLALPNPAINAIRSPFAADAAIRPIAGQIKVRLTDAVEAVGRALPEGSAPRRLADDVTEASFNGMLAIRGMQLYLAGAACTAGWFVLSNVRFRRRLRAGRVGPIEGQLRDRYAALCRELKVRPVPVYLTDPLPSACLAGVLRPFIALPLSAPPAAAPEVLRHELCHLRRRDHWWALVRLACCVVHWFNPLVWLAAALSRTDCELACDERAAGSMPPEQRERYAGALVLAASRRDTPGAGVLATGMTMAGSRLKLRVASVLAGGQARRGLAAAALLAAAMALAGAFATGEYLRLPPVPDSSQVPLAGTLDSEAAATAYARALWHSDELAQDLSGYAFSAEPQPSGGWLVEGVNGGDVLTLELDASGRVMRLVDGPGMRGYEAADTYTPLPQLDGEWGERLEKYLLSFAGRMDPDAAGRLQIVGRGVNEADGSRYATFALPHEEDLSSWRFCVQVEPALRIVRYVTPDLAV